MRVRNLLSVAAVLLALALWSPSASAQGFAWRGWCELGNQPTVTSGLTSSTVSQGSYPQCTVTVFVHGGGVASIYSDAGLTTPLANPFIATTSGFWTFYAAAGHYDVQNATSVDVTMPMPITYNDINLGGGGGGGESGTVTSVGFAAPTGFGVTGSPVTTIGTLTLAMPAGWTTGTLLIGNGANSAANLSIGLNGYFLQSNGATALWAALPTSLNTVTCMIVIGDQNSGTPLSTGNLEPQGSQCYEAQNGTMVSAILMVDSGASTLQLGYRHNGVTTAITGVLTPAVVAGITDPVACANVAGTAITIEGHSVTCGTLTNTVLVQGDYIETIGGTADGTTERVSAALSFTQPGAGGGGGGGGGAPALPFGSIQMNNLGAFGGSSKGTLDLSGNASFASVILSGSASGGVTLVAQAAAGTPTVTFGTGSGTPMVTASLPLVITTATGNGTCPTCVVATAPGAGIAHFAGATQAVTSSLIVSADITAGAVGPTQLAATAVVAGSYTSTNLTVDAQGRITAASSGSGPGSGVISLNGLTGVLSVTAGAGITVTPSGSSIAVAATGLADPGSNGMVARTALSTTAARTITGTASYIVVTNGTGAAGNPTINIGANVADLSIADTWAGLQTFSAGIKTAANQPIQCIEGTAPSAVSGSDVIYCDSATHTVKIALNGGGFATVPLATVTVPLGGTGLTTVAAGDLLCGNGTGTFTLITAGTSSQVLTSGGAGVCGSYQNAPTGMSATLDSVTAAMADSTIGNGTYQERWNYTLTAGKIAFYLGEASASTGANDYLFRVSTLSTSTANVVRFDNNGNGLTMNDVGVMGAIGTGSLAWTALSSFPTACTAQFVTEATTSSLGCASVDLTADVGSSILPVANGGTNTASAPVKRLLLRFAGCNAGTFAPSFDIPTSGGMGSNCKTDGTNGTVQGVMSAAHSQIAYATVILPDDWTSFNSAKIWFTTSDATNGHTIIFNVSTACTAPNGGNVDTPAYNAANAFTTVTIGGGATANALYDTTAGTVTGTGCAADDVLHLKFTRSGADTSTDTAISLTGDMVVAYNGTYQ